MNLVMNDTFQRQVPSHLNQTLNDSKQHKNINCCYNQNSNQQMDEYLLFYN